MFTNFFEKASDQDGAAPSQISATAKAKKRRRRRKGNRDKTAELPSSAASDMNTVTTKRKSSLDTVAPQSKRSRRQQGPSEEALALSAKLKEYSSQKRLNDALELYWHASNDSIRDGHHACIVIDCSARCGCIAVSSLI